MNDSVRPSVCVSVCLSVTPFPRCHHHRIIMKCLGVITIDRSYVHAQGQGQRSKVKFIAVKTQFSRFRIVTPVWIHTWRWNDAQRLVWHRKGSLLFFKVIRLISRSHATKIANFDSNRVFSDCNSSLNSPMAMKSYTKLYLALKRCLIVFQGHRSTF